MSQKPKKKFNKTKFIRFLLICGACLYVGWTLIYQQIEIVNTQKQLSAVDVRLEQQLQLQQELEQKKETVTTPEYIEKVAREDLDFAAPDEIVFVDASQK